MIQRLITASQPYVSVRPFSALRRAWQEGYGVTDLRRDAMAGLIVGVVALPLSMALAIASGVPPQHGLYTAITAGAIIALLGGSRVQVSGPTAAFVVILAPISARYGVGGLCMATMMAGLILMFMGAFRFGRLIEFIPYPVTTGFTAGIAVVIATLQIKDLLGLDIAMPETYVGKVAALADAMPRLSPVDLAIGVGTLAVLIVWPRFVTRRVPAALVALTLAAIAGWLIVRSGGPQAATIATRFTYELAGGGTGAGIPPYPPSFVLPWSLPGGVSGQPVGLSLETLRELLPSAFAIAMLGAIESLLPAVVADGMTGMKHDPDAELLAQGTGNLVTPFFGGIAATGAIARTATNVRSGGRSPIASVVHALFILAAMLGLAPLLGYLPMAALAALLLVVAWNMSEAKHFMHTLRVAPKSDVAVLVGCFALTVIFDMVVAVTFGILLAALLFMKRMTDITDVKLIQERHTGEQVRLPDGVLVYEIAGPLFFGAAQKAMSELRTIGSGVWLVIMDMRSVPIMDATGLVNLESALDRLKKAGIRVILAGVQKQPLQLLARAHLKRDRSDVQVVGNFEAALDLALWQSTERSAAGK